MPDLGRKVIVVTGPTASGKSALAFEIAKKIRGEIVNADSRQIYRYLDCGTSKPTVRERKSVPHHLYDFLDPKQFYSAGQYARDAENAIEKIIERKRIAIVVGGTGLYLRALFDGLSPLPERNETVRQTLLIAVQKEGKKAMHDRLRKIDPESALKIPFQNVQRVLRALEVFISSGKKISDFHRESPKIRWNFEPVFLGLLCERTALKERIRYRTLRLIPGILRETQGLMDRGYRVTDPGFQSLGYCEAVQVIEKKISPTEFSEMLVRKTWQYAKRQLTWFKRDLRIRWIRVEEPFDPESLSETILSFLVYTKGNKLLDNLESQI